MKKGFIILYILLSQIYLIGSNYQIITQVKLKKADQIYTFNHIFWAHDYDLYLTAVTQGKNGSLTYRDSYTTETTKPGIFYIYYIFIGKLADLFGISGIFAYHLVRIISQELYLLVLLLLSIELLGFYWGTLSSIIALTATISPSVFFTRPYEVGTFQPWWVGFDALERLNTLPHYLGGYVLLFTGLIFLFRYLKTHKIRFSVFGSVAFFAAGTIFPAVLTPVGLALPLALIVKILIHFIKLKRIDIKKITFPPGLLLIIISALAAYLIMSWQETQGFPWNIWRDWNISRWNRYELFFDRNSLFLFGLLPVIGLFSLRSILKSKSIGLIFIALWAYMPYLLLVSADILRLPKLRLFEDAHFIPFALLTGYTFSNLRLNNHLKISAITLMLSISIFTSYGLFTRKSDFVAKNYHPDLFYFSSDENKLLAYIQKNVPSRSVFLSDQRMGLLFPALTSATSYFAHISLTMDFLNKRDKVIAFYSTEYSEEEAEKFVFFNKINYIYLGKDEQKYGYSFLPFNFLKPVYSNPDGILYRVIKI